MPLEKKQPCFILVNPQMGENIGASARGMWNFGLERMRIVSPRDGWPNKKANTLSSGGGSVVDNAILYNNLNNAIKDLNFVFSTTIRSRKYSKEVFTPEEGIKFAKKLIESGNTVGILFGSERAGLEKNEISSSNAIISIPVNENFKSINLSHAVAVVSYEWFKNIESKNFQIKRDEKELEFVKKIEVEKFVKQLKYQLQQKGYFWPEDKIESLNLNIDNLFYSLKLTNPNLKTLFGIVKSLKKNK